MPSVQSLQSSLDGFVACDIVTSCLTSCRMQETPGALLDCRLFGCRRCLAGALFGIPESKRSSTYAFLTLIYAIPKSKTGNYLSLSCILVAVSY